MTKFMELNKLSQIIPQSAYKIHEQKSFQKNNNQREFNSKILTGILSIKKYQPSFEDFDYYITTINGAYSPTMTSNILKLINKKERANRENIYINQWNSF